MRSSSVESVVSVGSPTVREHGAQATEANMELAVVTATMVAAAAAITVVAAGGGGGGRRPTLWWPPLRWQQRQREANTVMAATKFLNFLAGL
jgi:hypothetical protein